MAIPTKLREAIAHLQRHVSAIDDTGNSLQLRALMLSCVKVIEAASQVKAATLANPMGINKIVISAVFPPIPTRQFDFSAHIDGTEDEQMTVGFGETPLKAVADLFDAMEDRSEVLCPISFLPERIFSGNVNLTPDDVDAALRDLRNEADTKRAEAIARLDKLEWPGNVEGDTPGL